MLCPACATTYSQNYEGMPANTTAAQRSSAMSRSMSIATFMPTHHHHTTSSSTGHTSSSYSATTAGAGSPAAAAAAGSAAAVPAEGELTLASAVTTLNGIGSAQHSLYMDLVVNGPGRVTFGQPLGSSQPRPPSPLQAAPTMTAYFQQIEEGDEENEDGIFF
jgi:hypothetical protein